VRPHDAVGNASEVFVLNDAGGTFVDHLRSAHRGAAGGGLAAEEP